MGRRDALSELLAEARVRIGLRPEGFTNFRGLLAKRIKKRARALGIEDVDGIDGYRAWLGTHDEEWRELDAICRVTISRLYRDAPVMDRLAREVLPRARRVWSAGCASGEEPYTIALLAPHAKIVATEIDAALLERAKRAEFGESSLRELPPDLRVRLGAERDALRARITFLVQDLRKEAPPGPFDLVLCRNVAFTYFDVPLQREVLARIRSVLTPEGELVIGKGERLPNP